MYIAIDFDGTCVKHRYPYVGDDVPNAIFVLNKLVSAGVRIILYTMRDNSSLSPYDKNKTVLDDAREWFRRNNIPLFGINENPHQTWSDSRKIFADMYIDDANIGCPLVYKEGERPYVDWDEIENELIVRGIIEFN